LPRSAPGSGSRERRRRRPRRSFSKTRRAAFRPCRATRARSISAAADGAAVEKSEANGTHDGRIVACPCIAQPGKVYQRPIDTILPDGGARDLRTHVVGGRVVAVWIKRRSAAGRFLPANLSVAMAAPADVFSPAEIDRIEAFARALGADWAGLDVLRDEPSGKIYIVDVSKTDAGPIIALSLSDKLRSVAVLAEALQGLIAGAS
jgi:hypothetical protein